MINDITTNIHSKLQLFADDILIYRPIPSSSDQISLQDDLANYSDKMSRWIADGLQHIQMQHFTSYHTSHCQKLYIPHEWSILEISGKDWNLLEQ